MKNILLPLLGLTCLLLGSFPAQARGIERGDQTVSVFFGGAVSVSDSEIEVEAPWGTTSAVSILDGAVSYGAQYLYAVNPYLSIGAEFNANNFESTTDRIWGSSYEETINSKTDVYSLFAAGRLTANPSHSVRLYLPFGLGLAAAKNSMSAHITGVGSNSGSDTHYSFIYYAGLGLEGSLTQDWILGLEMRYSQFVLDTSQLVKNGGDEYFSFLAFMLKLSYRF